MNRRHVTIWVILVAGLIGLGGVVWRWGGRWLAFFHEQERIQAWVASWGAWGPLMSIALNVAQVVAAPVPGQALNLANGYLFGVGAGTLYSMVGVLLGSLLAMNLARRWGRPAVVKWVAPRQLSRLDDWAERRGALFFFIVFLLPFVPDDLACFAIGLSRLSIPKMMVLATLARLPGVLSSVWLGAYATRLSWKEWLVLSVLVALAGGLAWRWMRSGELDGPRPA